MFIMQHLVKAAVEIRGGYFSSRTHLGDRENVIVWWTVRRIPTLPLIQNSFVIRVRKILVWWWTDRIRTSTRFNNGWLHCITVVYVSAPILTNNVVAAKLPLLHSEAIGLKRILRQCLGEVVGVLQLGVDGSDCTSIAISLLVDKLPEPVPLDKKEPGAIGDSLVVGKKIGSLVVFESDGSDGGTQESWEVHAETSFLYIYITESLIELARANHIAGNGCKGHLH